jgi:hypothetical protein
MPNSGQRVVATRQLRDAERPDVPVELRLYMPEPDGEDWSCSFEVVGLDEPISHRGYGVDALQALQIALELARLELDKSGRTLLWLGEVRGSGIYRTVAHGFGAGFGDLMDEHLNGVIDREMERLSSELIAARGLGA